MKKAIYRMMSVIAIVLFLGHMGYASVPVHAGDPNMKGKPQLTYTKSMKVSDAEAQLGREMKFMEKFAFRLNRKKFVEAYNVQAADGSGETDGFAIAGFVVSLLIPIVGLVLSAVALGRLRKNGQKGRGLAVAGLILGIVGTVLALIILL